MDRKNKVHSSKRGKKLLTQKLSEPGKNKKRTQLTIAKSELQQLCFEGAGIAFRPEQFSLFCRFTFPTR